MTRPRPTPSDSEVQKATLFLHRDKQPQGLTSLRITGWTTPGHARTGQGRSYVRFGRLPKKWRPVAERELQRLLTRYTERTGHGPTPAKLASLHANACAIVINHRMRQIAKLHPNKWKKWNMTWAWARGTVDKADRQLNADLRKQRGTEVDTKRPQRRSRWALGEL